MRMEPPRPHRLLVLDDGVLGLMRTGLDHKPASTTEHRNGKSTLNLCIPISCAAHYLADHIFRVDFLLIASTEHRNGKSTLNLCIPINCAAHYLADHIFRVDFLLILSTLINVPIASNHTFLFRVVHTDERYSF